MIPSGKAARKPRFALVARESYFMDFVEGCMDSLERQGLETSHLPELPPDGSWDAILVVGIHQYLKIPFYRRSRLLGIQTEQLPIGSEHEGRLTRNLCRFQAVRGHYEVLFDWNPSLYEAGRGGDLFIPYGCRQRPWNPTEKTHDLLFIGSLHDNPRRQALMRELSHEFNLDPEHSPGFGEARSTAIRRAAICLNVHYYSGAGFESPRVFDYLSHGAFVLSERAPSCYPFKVGRDLEDFGDVDELKSKIRHFLSHPEQRERITRQGHETAQQWGFGEAAGILEEETQRLLATRFNPVRRWSAWAGADSRCRYFLLRDYLSIQRRKLLA